ncbi:MAG TPA: Asp-tRNA(Asn)/Glu-tRNA(Gln) amidotransferase subunit GatC [Candidatus Saccharimonadia bacterium]|nr:Asp-tRNA(Asn)/Glu-tRNA(Gln) amidotransferase subunit GatC [Candidatus Saccharimonadia bacterium]
MSKIGTTEVERIARLARIGLSPEETAQMSIELGQILEFVTQLSKINVENTAPTDQVTGLEDVWREDIVRPGLSREQLLANVPHQKDGYIVVKRVLNG